jgi:hypothetical protein
MIRPTDFIATTDSGQLRITITPINVSPAENILYATGEYALTEGEVGLGTITFETDTEWTFDGITDLNENIVKRIADFIKQIDHHPAPLVDGADNVEGSTPPAIATETEKLDFMLDDKGKPLNVLVVINYPFYDVSINGENTAQLEQDHHSNWFVTTGKLDDKLLQQIGRRIAGYIAGN